MVLMDRSRDRVEIFQRADALWDWRRLAANGENLCGSQQGYVDVTYCEFMAINLCADLLDEERFSRVPLPITGYEGTKVAD